MKFTRLLSLVWVFLLGSLVLPAEKCSAAETNIPTSEATQVLSYTPKLRMYCYPDWDYGLLLGWGFYSETNVLTVITVANDPGGPWYRFPWKLRLRFNEAQWVYFPWYFVKQDKQTYFRIGQVPDTASRKLVYSDRGAPGGFVTNRLDTYDRLPVANWISNRIVAVGNTLEARAVIDENTVPGTTKITLSWFNYSRPVYVPPVITPTNAVGNTNTVGGTNSTGSGSSNTSTNSNGTGTGPGGTVIGGSGSNGTGSGNNGGTNAVPPDPNSNPVPPAAPARVTSGLNGILEDFSTKGFAEFSARIASDAGPKYSSSSLETNHWFGTITVPTNGPLALYVRSDDGCRVTINGVVEHDTFGMGVPWNNRARSVALVACLPAGSINQIVVDYSNIKKGQSGDNDDGISLYLVGDYSPTRILGSNAIPFFGNDGSDEFTYTLAAHGSYINWTTSPNLRIVSSNDTLHTISVVATGPSANYWDSWIEANWYSLCGRGGHARFQLTVFKPTSMTKIASTPINGAVVGSTFSYQIVDQFNNPFTFPSYISVTPWPSSGRIPQGTVFPNFKNRFSGNGRLADGMTAPRGAGPFTISEAVYCHRTVDAVGVIVGIIYLEYEGTSFTPRLFQ